MNTRKILKASVSIWVIILSVIFFTQNAFPWGSATHAYIDDNIGKNDSIGKKMRLANLDVIYGGMAPDMFNFYPEVLVPDTVYNDLYIQTHFNSLALWSEAQKLPGMTSLEKAAAFGFVSHANGQWFPVDFSTTFIGGADYTAHGPGGDDTGFYVIDKAKQLWFGGLKSQLPELTDIQGLSASHNIIEFAIDIMVAYEIKQGGTGIGKKMVESALHRTPKFPLLAMKTYASDPQTKEKIISAERDFRRTIIIYGQALSQESEDAAISTVAGLLAQLAQEVYGILVTPGLVKDAILAAKGLCQTDYAAAIDNTIIFVNGQMDGFSYEN